MRLGLELVLLWLTFFHIAPLKQSIITELTKVLQIKTSNNQTHDEKQNITQMNHDEVETTETSKSA